MLANITEQTLTLNIIRLLFTPLANDSTRDGTMVDIRRPTLSLEKAAEHFDVTVKTVRCWIRGVGGRRLEAVKLGGTVRTTWEAIERFMVPLDAQEFRPEQTDFARHHAESSKAFQEQFGRK